MSVLFFIEPHLIFRRALVYYNKAAELGDKRAQQRLRGAPNQPLSHPGGKGAVLHRSSGEADGHGGKGPKDKDCVIM
jgi:TPR repeat protein